jgi:hypothetical protein
MNDLVVSAVRYEAPVGKPYKFKNDEVIKGANHRSNKAVGETHAFPSFEEFSTWRKGLTSEFMLTSGTFDTIGEVAVVYKGAEGAGEASASQDYLAHREQPGIVIGDIDFKEPDEVAGLYLGGDQPYQTHEAALTALSKVLPEADGCALLVGWSTSSNIFKGEKQVKGTGGIRLYLPVTDASEIPSLLDTMHKRSWLHNGGWGFVDEAGKFQERSLLDQALKTVTQPDFAAPDLKGGLTQDREWQDFEGDYLDPKSITPLTPEEEEQYQGTVAAAKNKLAPEMEAQRKVWLAKAATEHEKKGLNPKRAMAAAIQLLDNGVLFPTGSVLFDDGTEVSVRDLLTEGSAHDGKTCKDPVEPEYNGGASVGQYYWNDGERPGVHSFAHGSKWYAIKHSSESAKATFESGDYDEVSFAIAQTAFTSKSEELQLEKLAARALGLGQSVKPFRADVAELRKRIYAKGGSDNSDAASNAVIAEGRWPLDKPLPPEIFPIKKDAVILSHADNYKTMMAAYGYGCSYDVIKKDVFWTGPQIDMTTDNAFLALFSRMKGLTALNGLPHGNADLNAHLPAIAEQNQINPVRVYLEALEWDGTDRFEQFAREMETHDLTIAEIALRVWFTGAAATCEHFETGLRLVQGARPSFEYVLALRGDQGVKKTKGFLGFVPKSLSKYAKDGATLNPRDKDSVKIAVSYWLVELGELDATFKQGQIADLKAFLSTEADELRLAYAQGYSKFKRRTAFIGTVNQDKFLKDETGNRRYLVLDCAKGFPMWSPEEIDQLWAQAWARYVNGAQWWPTNAEQKLLDANAELFRQRTWVEEALETEYDWGKKPTDKSRVKTTELLKRLKGNPYGNCDAKEVTELGHALRRLWSENGAYKDGRSLVIQLGGGDPLKVNADGGKHKGWLLPPSRMKRFERAHDRNS